MVSCVGVYNLFKGMLPYVQSLADAATGTTKCLLELDTHTVSISATAPSPNTDNADSSSTRTSKTAESALVDGMQYDMLAGGRVNGCATVYENTHVVDVPGYVTVGYPGSLYCGSVCLPVCLSVHYTQ